MKTLRRFSSFAAMAALAASLWIAPASQAAGPLLLQWGTIDTSGTEAQAESAALKSKLAKKAAAARKAGAAAETRAAYVVQFPGPVTDEWRTWLEASTEVRGYLPEFAYLVWATASEMEAIAANPNVFWTGEWKKDYKTVCVGTASAAKGTAAASADEARWMQVGSLLTGDDGAADLCARLEALPADVRSAFPRLDGSSAVAFLTDAQIDEVAAWPDVEWIEPKLKARLFNDQAARTNMMNVSNAWKALSSGGLGLTGAGQIVAVADTGCDKGSKTDTHADFSGRILAGYGWTNGAYKASASWADIDAHGTHVCGSVLGSGAKSSGQFRGMAYEAQLVMQGMWEDLGGLPDYTGDMLKQAYTNGARIHSDSWGFGTNFSGKYIYDAAYSDGYMWTNQNFIMVIAAGNDGIDKNKDGVIDAGSVSCPGTAKNCLCVGAAENYRSTGGYSEYGWGSAWSSDYPADPIKSDKISQTTTPQGLAAFSGRGPTLDGRFKPDIVAPGTDVISVRSRMAQDDGWGIYTSNTNYLYEGGTSMATPLTSGALALVRQWLVDRKGINEPMAALMKALLINGARDMTPGQYGTGSYKEITARPDRSQGFGHVNLYNSLEPGTGNFLHFVTNKLTTGANFTTNINVGQANAGTYVLTLAWQDYPGTEEASKTLVNDLDLTVTSPSGTVYYPNNYGKLDHTNNVEFIEFTAAETGTYSVKVNGYSVSKTSPHGGQPFALVMRGPETSLEPTAPEFSTTAASATGVVGETFTYNFASLLTAGYPTPTYRLHTSVSSYSFDTTTGLLTFTPSAAGSFNFTCLATNENGSATCALTVTVTLPPPDIPTGLTLSNVGTTSFTAAWNAAANADSYRIDVVEGSSFEGGVGDAVLEADFSSTSGWTLSGTGTYTGSAYYGAGSPSIKFDGTGDYAISPDFGSGVKLQFWALGNGGAGSTFAISGLVNGSWTDIETVSIDNGGATYEVTLPSGTSQVRFDFAKSVNCALDDVVVYGPGAEAGEYVAGWSNATVNATSVNVTGLQPATDYAVRVRAANSTGTSGNSATATATTLAGLSAPSWSAIPAQSYLFGSNGGTFDFDVSPYASGSPAPEFHLADTPLEAILFTSGEFSFEPEALGTFDFTVIASNNQGTASTTFSVAVTAAPPAFVNLPATVGGTTAADVTFTVAATGNPAPVLAVDADESLLYTFNASTGEFEFYSDVTGDFSFTFTAANIAGTATQTVTVTITDAPVTVPTLSISNITDTSALASWNACDGVSSYTLQLASDDQFTTGGSGATVTLFSNDGTSATAPDGWTYSINSASSGYPVLASNNYVVSEAVDASSCIGLSLSLSMRTYGAVSSGTTNLLVQYSADGGASWTDIGNLSVPNKTWATRTLDASAAAGAADLRIRFVSTSPSTSSGVGIQNIVLTGTESAGTGSLISTDTVNGLSHAFTGLDPVTTYYARVKGTSDWSTVVSFTTQSTGDSAPVWTAIPSQTVDVGTNCWLNLADYVSGTPAPAITLVSATADSGDYECEDGYLMFAPPAAGSYSFTFMASNSVGAANATLTVTGHAEAPVLTASLGTALSSTVGENVEFTVAATGIPVPATIDATCTEGASFVFVDGGFLFDSPAVGTYHFVFTATNVAGSDTLTVTIVVSAAPVTVPVLTVTNITDTTALATWTPCEGVSTYTLQLTDDAFPAASSSAARSLTPILSENFSGFTANDSTDISESLDNYTQTSGWNGSKVFCNDGEAKLGASSGQPWLVTPALTVSGSLTVVWEARRYGDQDKSTLFLGISEDGTDFTDTSITLYDDMTVYTNTFEVSGTNAWVCWRGSGTSKARFYLDNVRITTPESGGGDDPSGDSVQEFTVTGTSYTFTNLTPATLYAARVKGNAGWSEEVLFETEAAAGSAPIVRVPQDSYSVLVGAPAISFAVTATGTPAPTVTATCTEGASFDFENNEFTFEPSVIGTYHFVFTATNSEGSDSKTVTVTVAGAEPSISVPQASYAVTVGDTVNFTVNATGAPEPTVTATCTEGAGFVFENKAFQFTPAAAGTYHFVFTATNSEGSDSETVTIVVSPPPVTVPELTVSDVTDTTALATWTACDDVTTYTLQLSTNDFAAVTSSAAARDVTTLLTEHFTNATGSSTAAISDFDAVTDNKGWEGSYVYLHNGSLRISSGSHTGDIESPWLTNATAGATVTLAFDSLSWTNAGTIVNVTVTEDGSTYSDPISFALTETMTTYTTNFPVYGTRFRVRWAPSAANKRFFLDNVVISSATSGGDDIEEFTVAGTSHTFTNLPPETTYYARVKGEADWSNVEEFTTLATPVPPAWSADFPASWSMTVGDSNSFAVADYLSGDPAPTVTLATDAPSGDYRFENGTFTCNPTSAGTFTFAFTASNTAGTASATLTVTVTDDSGAIESYVEWLERSDLDPTIPADSTAPDGKTYEWHYITDTLPSSGQEPGIVIATPDSDTFTVSGVSEFRYYQLVYTTDLSLPLESYTTVNLGWGEYLDTFPFPVSGDWFGGIRVLLEEPEP